MLANDLAVMLESASVGTKGTDLFIGPDASLPPGDGPYVSVLPTGGTSPDDTQTSSYRRPSAQIVARAKDYKTAETKAIAAFNAVVNKFNQTINGVWYLSITPNQSEPFDMGKDDVGRPRVGFNVNAVKRP